ncbi:MAG: ParB N-terminal domain-containing protein [Pseudomonadota bacterium]
MAGKKYPGVQRVETEDDLRNVVFVDDMAEIEIPIAAFDTLPLTNAERIDSDRLRRVEASIRAHGYDNFDRIVARMGRRGRLSIVNGGHRLTAARNVARQFWPNLFGEKVRTIHMFVFRTANSETMIGVPDGAPEPPVSHPTDFDYHGDKEPSDWNKS